MARSRKKSSSFNTIFLLSLAMVLAVILTRNSSTILGRAQESLEKSINCPSPADGAVGLQMVPCSVPSAYDPYAPKSTPTPNTQSTTTSGGYTSPNEDTCGGKAKLNKTFKKNYGEPKCNFDKDKLFTLLKQKDPENAQMWFNKIVSCESGYNTNAYADINAPDQAKLDAGGAWGLFQMGSSKPPGSPPPAPGKNGALDRGDVNWEIQVANAIGTQKKAGNWKYWSCARK